VHVRELGRDGLAHDDATGFSRERHACGVTGWPVVAIDQGAVLGRHVRRVDDVLHADRHPEQRSAVAAAVERSRTREDTVGVAVLPRLDFGFARGDLLEARAHDGFAGGIAAGDGGDDFCRGQLVQRAFRAGHCRVSPSP
jgi:hypothetical protein